MASGKVQIKIKDLSKDYQLGKTVIPALKGIELNVNHSDFMVISGASGSGKTTLLNLIGLIDQPSSGEIHFDSQNGSPGKHSYRFRRDKLGYIFQTFNLIPVLNVYENVEYPLILKNIAKKERKERVSLVLEKVGLQDRMKHKPRELSGGQRQRVSIARAVVKSPDIILADEPTANLDSNTGLQILNLMRDMNAREKITFIFSSHDPMIVEMGRRVITLKDGEIIKTIMN